MLYIVMEYATGGDLGRRIQVPMGLHIFEVHIRGNRKGMGRGNSTTGCSKPFSKTQVKPGL